MELRKYLWAMVVATFNMTAMVLVTLLAVWHTAAKWRMHFHPDTLPTFWRVVADITLCTIFNDVCFYYLHR